MAQGRRMRLAITVRVCVDIDEQCPGDTLSAVGGGSAQALLAVAPERVVVPVKQGRPQVLKS